MATLEDLRARISSQLGRDAPPPPTLDSLKERIRRSRYVPIPAPVAPDLTGQGLPRATAHAIGRGFASGVAGIPESLGIEHQASARWLVEQYDKIDRGERPDLGDSPATVARVSDYRAADPETRGRLRERATAAVRPIGAEPLYRAGRALQERTAEVLPIAPEHRERFPVKLGYGLGSTGAFLATGIAGRLARLPAFGVTAGTGALVNASAQFQEAMKSGASFEDAVKASRIAGIVGTTEAVPIAQLLDRFDRGTGGSVRRIITSAVAGGTEEGLQEGFQSVMENLIASDLVKYDPERGIFQGTGENAGIGFTVGTLFNTLAGMAGVRPRGTPDELTDYATREGRIEPILAPATRPPAAARRVPTGPAFAPSAGVGTVGPGPGPGGPEVSQPVAPRPGDAAREFVRRQIREIQGRRTPERPAQRGPAFPGKIPPAPETPVSEPPGVTEGPSLPAGIPRRIFRGQGRDRRGTVYSGPTVPILGQGRYFAFTPEAAQQFGPEVEAAELQAKNPLVIRSDDEWRALTKEAGWEFPNPFGLPEAQVREMTDRLQAVVRRRGHDAVVVYWNEAELTDTDRGRPIKNLRNVFGVPQAVFLEEGQTGGPGVTIPPPPRPRVRKATLTLAEFLAARGGIQDQTGELRAMDADKWHRGKPFRKRLVRNDGLTPDYAREAAEEAGYLPPGSDLADLYDALDRDLRGVTVAQGPTLDRVEMENAAARLGIPGEAVARLSDNDLAAILARETTIEQTEQGPQRVIPGAERISERELVERRMRGRIQPTVRQRAADEGLFDVAGRGQTDIEDILAGRPQPESVEIPDTVFSQPPTAEALRARIGQARGMAPPGDRFVGHRQDTVEGTPPPGGKPIRREDVLRPLLTALNVPLYQGRMKGRKLLGFYRRGIEEVRIKRMSDIEVAAHELAHMLDDRIPEIRQQWLPASKANETIREELRGVSYDRSKLFEGFAEFVRLWATQRERAREASPNFFGWFEDFVARSEYGPALRKAQQDMHAWFAQDAVSRARSKIGLAEDINAGLTGFWDRFRQGVSDDLHGIMRMERELTGDISPVGPYETARLTRAKYSIIEGAILYGAPVVNPDGSHSYQGKGLQQILDPVANRLDDFLMYAVGRSAAELREQGREHLFTAAEIKGMTNLETPAFKDAFDQYQIWNRAILDFAEAKGVINPAARALWKRTQYLPFHRVGQPGAFSPVPGDWRGIRALTGGTDNLRDILGNMVGNAAMLMDAALTNEARVEVAKLAKQRGGAHFMARIPTEERTVKVHQAEIERTILEALGVRRKTELPVELQSFLDSIMANLGGFVPLIQRGQAPYGQNVVAVLHAGKPIYYEVADPLLYSALTHLNRPARHGLINILGGFKRLGQASITLSIDFLTANIARDTLMGFVMSRTGFKPFVDSARGLKSRLMTDDNYKAFIANGGGFSSYFVDEAAFRKHLERFYTKRGINYRTVLDSPAKLLYAVERIADSFEMATRLGEFRRARARGEHPRHAAYLGREVSTDFAMRGDWRALGAAYDTIIFLKAAVNGIDRLYRGVTQDPNRLAVAGKTAALAMLSMGLASLWRGIPEWDDMEDWDRDTHWHFFIPTPETMRAWSEGRSLPPIEQRYEHFRYPKIWEIGMVASLAERTVQRLLDDDAGELPKDFARIVMDTFRIEYLPQFLAPVAEAGVPFTEMRGINRLRFFDRPIQSERLLDLQPWARAAPYTSHTLRKLGEVSRDLPRGMQPIPVQVEALLRGYFNTWALYGLTLSDAMFFDDAPSLRLDQLPGIRRFYRQTPGRSRYVNEFYDMVKEATEARRTMREMARRYQPGITQELAYSPANLEYGQLTRAQKGMQRLGAATRLVLAAPDLATLQELASRMAEDRRLGPQVTAILRSKSGSNLGDLKRDLRDLLMAEQNKLAKTVVQSVKARRELVAVQ